MPSNANNVILTFPPRPVSDWERTPLADWFATTEIKGLGIARAYVSERRGDDPMIVGRIVIVAWPSKEPTHLIYSPAGSTFWVAMSPKSPDSLRRFRTLRTALNSIRPVFEERDAPPAAERASDLVC